MTTDDLLNELDARDIRLWREGTRLRYNAPSGALTAALRAEIAARKAALLERTPELPGKPVPLSFAQVRLWFHEQLQPDAGIYNIPGAVRVIGPLEIVVLEKSLGAVLARHEALRTAIVSERGNMMGAVVPMVAIPLLSRDLSHLDPVSREAFARELILQEHARPFNLAQPPLVRAFLVRLATSEHLLALTLHHIAGDGWSIALLIREIVAHYTAFLSGTPAAVAPLSIQYGDYARRQRRELNGAARDELRAFWKDYLAGAPVAVDLPTDWRRPATERFEGREISQSLPIALMTELSRLAVGARATLFMVLASAFLVLVHRHSGRREMVIGTALSGRETSAEEALIGFFINSLPLRCMVLPEDTVISLLQRFRMQTLCAYDHAAMPFEQVVEAVAPPRDLSRAPVFQVMFNFLNQPKEIFAVPGCNVSPFRLPNRTSKLDLTLAVEEQEGRFSASIEFRTSLFNDERIRRMLAQYEALLTAFSASPDRRVGSIPLLNSGEIAVRTAVNATQRDVPVQEALHHAFERRAASNPETVAYAHRGRSLSYGELNARADQVAASLVSQGFGRETIAAIFIGRNLLFPIAAFGILKAGAAYLPLDIDLPAERVLYMLEDSGAAVLLTTAEYRSRLPDAALPTMDIDRIDFPAAQDSVSVNGAELAYLIYTSGSTGVPKSVEINHRAAVNLVRSLARRLDFKVGETLLAAAPFSFDMSVADLFLPTSVGGTTVFLDRVDSLDSKRLEAIISETGASALQATASAWRLLLSGGWRCPPGFRAYCGGEAFPAELAVALLAAGAEVWNLYGPTETTVWSAAARIQSGDEAGFVGAPLDNTQLYIIDSSIQPVPAGVPGELCIGGAGLARGYRKRPGLTAERFIPNPFGLTPGERIYRTGDLARFDFEGHIEILGRIDRQVKIRGNRVELGEIEAVLESHPAVARAAVVIQRDNLGEIYLAAYWQSRPDCAPPQLQEHLAKRLPAYMLPKVLSQVDSWPMNANGKLDYGAIVARTPYPEIACSHCAPPRTALEASMTALWRSMLKAPIGIRDNFFEQGGHSFLAIHLLASVRQEFGEGISLSAFLQEPTIEAVCRKLGGIRSEYSPLVRLSAQSSHPHFFFVPGASGNPFSYSALARHLETEAVFYGLQPPEDKGGIPSIPELAASYVEAVCDLQPNGRIRLGGHSFGAIVAFDMARQLLLAGREVALLAIVDMEPPHISADRFHSHSESEWLAEIADALERFAGRAPGTSLKNLSTLPLGFAKECFLRGLVEAGLVPADSTLALVDLLLDRYRSSQEALSTYRPHPTSCPLTIVRCVDGTSHSAALPYLGWQPFALGRISEVTVPGDHITVVVEPQVSVLGASLRELLGSCRT